MSLNTMYPTAKKTGSQGHIFSAKQEQHKVQGSEGARKRGLGTGVGIWGMKRNCNYQLGDSVPAHQLEGCITNFVA
jgi:hypothetical protein